MAELHIFPAPDQVLPGWVTRAGCHQEPVWARPEQVWRDLEALGHPGAGRVGLGPGMETSDQVEDREFGDKRRAIRDVAVEEAIAEKETDAGAC